jgi:RHS repeat-associated protein
VVITNATVQTIAWQAKYDPFGNAVMVTSSITNNQRLPGQWFQLEDGLAYNWHRTYDATLGRYSQADPLGFVDGPGVYAYAGGSPVMGVDPEGLVRGKRGQTGGSSGLGTPSPYKHCREAAGDPTKIECKNPHTGKWDKKPRPADWERYKKPKPIEQCDTCETVEQVVVIGGTVYLVWRCIRMIPSLYPPFWGTIPPNLVTP